MLILLVYAGSVLVLHYLFVLAGAKIYVYNLPLIVGSFLAIGGLLWGLLLVLNNDKVEKRTKHRYCSDSI